MIETKVYKTDINVEITKKKKPVQAVIAMLMGMSDSIPDLVESLSEKISLLYYML